LNFELTGELPAEICFLFDFQSLVVLLSFWVFWLSYLRHLLLRSVGVGLLHIIGAVIQKVRFNPKIEIEGGQQIKELREEGCSIAQCF
jgi:hypothetical protein